MVSKSKRSSRRKLHAADIIDLGVYRRDRLVADYLRRLNDVITTNRETLSHLFRTGLIFHRLGLKAGRGLLRSHENLLRIRTLLRHARVLATAGRPAAEKLLGDLDCLLTETNRLTEETRAYIARIHAGQ